MNMIPNGNNLNNYNNLIKIQLTNDNKCIIHTISESPIKSQNTIIKEDISLNDMSLSKSNSIIKNNSHNSSKKIKSDLVNNNATKNMFSDFDSNSNLLISFSNISEVAKVNNNDCSMTRINSNKNNSILINKDKYFSLNISNNNSNIPSSQMKIKTGDKLDFAIIVCDLNGLKQINDTLGHKAGDGYIKDGCEIICDAFSRSPVYRIGGDEFVVVAQGKDYDQIEDHIETINKANADNKKDGKVTLAVGAAKYSPEDKFVSDVFKRADAIMYENKRKMKEMTK